MKQLQVGMFLVRGESSIARKKGERGFLYTHSWSEHHFRQYRYVQYAGLHCRKHKTPQISVTRLIQSPPPPSPSSTPRPLKITLSSYSY